MHSQIGFRSKKKQRNLDNFKMWYEDLPRNFSDDLAPHLPLYGSPTVS
jgi:hypothetical protein